MRGMQGDDGAGKRLSRNMASHLSFLAFIQDDRCVRDWAAFDVA